MRFSAVTALACLSAFATAASIPAEARSATDVAEAPAEKRQLLTALVTAALTAAATEAGTLITEKAINAAVDAINNTVKDFDSAREAFTQATTLEMWNNNPDPVNNVAVVCYNMGYGVQDSTKINGLVSVKISMGLLNTDYDCMYMTGPNAFWTYGDGGFQNVAFRYSSACTYDPATVDLTCAAA